MHIHQSYAGCKVCLLLLECCCGRPMRFHSTSDLGRREGAPFNSRGPGGHRIGSCCPLTTRSRLFFFLVLWQNFVARCRRRRRPSRPSPARTRTHPSKSCRPSTTTTTTAALLQPTSRRPFGSFVADAIRKEKRAAAPGKRSLARKSSSAARSWSNGPVRTPDPSVDYAADPDYAWKMIRRDEQNGWTFTRTSTISNSRQSTITTSRGLRRSLQDYGLTCQDHSVCSIHRPTPIISSRG
jgi:hypothetical protein